MNSDEKEMYDFAYTLTQSAGIKLKLERKHSEFSVTEKTSQMDLVTEHDILIENYLTEAIIEKYPGHFILAEEKTYERRVGIENNNGYIWIIDPIDGTINYYRSGKDYAISIALYKNGEPIFGFVYDVANEILFSARNGIGAGINGCRLSVQPDRKEALNKAVVAMSLRTMKELNGKGMDVLGMLSKVQAFRYLGCASLELCKVANGEYDLFISSNVHEWDVAAARIFLEQRGCHLISHLKEKNGSPSGKLLAAAYSSPKIWEEALEHLPKSVRNDFGYL